MRDPFCLTTYDFDLPEELIARAPSPKRDACRLLCLDRHSGTITHRQFHELPELLPTTALLVFNDSKVLKARLFTCDERGKSYELLFLHSLTATRFRALIRGRSVRSGLILRSPSGSELKVLNSIEGNWELESDAPILDLLAREGEMPLPPYILKSRLTHHQARLAEEDDTVYQTVYAKNPGSVAAPTAGLHFTPELIGRLHERNIETTSITLHVGWGTFQPIRTSDIREHHMHTESFEISPDSADRIGAAKCAGRPIVAVGSTSVRALESAWDRESHRLRTGPQSTSLFISPGYPFTIVDQMITNFHTPKSSLLVMVSAFAGVDHIRSAYETAIHEKYRFYSYGDAMWIA